MSEHTKLPWMIDRRCSTHITGKKGRAICSSGGYSNNTEDNSLDENEANAAHIVKACNAYPELIMLCKHLVRTFPETDCSKLDASYFVDHCCDTIAAAEKAKDILKKVGEL